MDTVPPMAASMATAPSGSNLPCAKDMSHHVNRVTKNRLVNSLKEMYKYAVMPGMIPMAGGIPSPELFPFESVSAEVLPYNYMALDPPRVPKKHKANFFEWLFGRNLTLTIPKYAPNPKDPLAIQLSTSLQYQQATGPPAFPIWLRHYVSTVLKPKYADWDVLLSDGATDGFNKVFNMLLELGDSILVEEWSYPGAMNAYLPWEAKVATVKMDGEGVLPEDFEAVLANWDESRGRRPKVFYTVPTGQNPTGATMMAERKQKIYDICCKYDVIIVEDEPYYCLFTGPWIPQGKKATPLMAQQLEAEKKEGREGDEAFLKSLPPAYLSLDTEGRVIRLDTFSKTSCPGSRLGWITSSPIFIERLTRISESSTQAPSGFVTALTITLLNTWGWNGYLRWLRGIKATYRMRRDWMCDALADSFHLEFDDNSVNPHVQDIPGIGRGYTAYALPPADSAEGRWDEKRGLSSVRGKPLVSFVPPTAGMFIFLAVHLDQHPDFYRIPDATNALMDKLWRELAEHLVLFAPGVAFDPLAAGGRPGGHEGEGVGYFRMSYSITTYEQIRYAMGTFAKVLKKFLHAE